MPVVSKIVWADGKTLGYTEAVAQLAGRFDPVIGECQAVMPEL